MTKDERFLIEIYRAVQAKKDVKAYINPIEIAKSLGFKEVLTREILKGLRQGNLIKVYSPEEIMLTERGLEVARSLLVK